MEKQLNHNIKVHDKVFQAYEKMHGEIYNEVEQKRLEESLKSAYEKIENKPIEALDFGCGAGNLTQYLLKMNIDVTAADVSENFLQLIKLKFAKKYGKKLNTLKLNGENLENVNDNTFDFIATYSVLHHIPNYLLAVNELARVLKPGGILYIDHEASPETWAPGKELREFNKLSKKAMLKATKIERLKHLFIPVYWINACREFFDPKFKAEGDIHVFQDDHIEWEDVLKILKKNRIEVLFLDDYLLYPGHYSNDLYESYKNRCADTRLLVAMKKN